MDGRVSYPQLKLPCLESNRDRQKSSFIMDILWNSGVGMLCWGLLANVRPLVDLYEYLLKSSTDMAREAPPQRKSRILGGPLLFCVLFCCMPHMAISTL